MRIGRFRLPKKKKSVPLGNTFFDQVPQNVLKRLIDIRTRENILRKIWELNPMEYDQSNATFEIVCDQRVTALPTAME